MTVVGGFALCVILCELPAALGRILLETVVGMQCIGLVLRRVVQNSGSGWCGSRKLTTLLFFFRPALLGRATREPVGHAPESGAGPSQAGKASGRRLSGVVIVIHPKRFCSEQARAASTRQRQSRGQSAD